MTILDTRQPQAAAKVSAKVPASKARPSARASGLDRQAGPITTEPPPLKAYGDFAHVPIHPPAATHTHEAEADRLADDVVSRLGGSLPPEPKGHLSGRRDTGAAGPAGGHEMGADLRRGFERAFGWDFSRVRLHAGPRAAGLAKRLGSHAFTQGYDVVFGGAVKDPEAPQHRRLLAHELTHVVQQGMGMGAPAPRNFSSLSAAAFCQPQAAPLVTQVATSAAELGVGGPDITATATVGGHPGPLAWQINPGGAAPAGVSLIGAGRRVRVHAAQPGAGVVVGGTPIIIRAAVGGGGDHADSAPVNLVQVVSAAYAAAPPLAAVPSLIPGVPPPNSAEPNRDGIAGNTARVNAVTAPPGRAISVAFRRALGARIAGPVVTPGAATGDIRLRITDQATRARLDETQPSVAGPAALMADLTVNAVPTRVRALANAGALGPYGQLNAITFASSDVQHPPLTRIVGELITNAGDGFNIAPPNAGFNPAFLLALAVPANNWNDQLITPAAIPNAADGRPAIDVNRFVGPGVPHLPRRLIYRQRFVYSSWQGAGTVVSRVIADGRHIRSLIGAPPAAFQFRTEHRFPPVAAPVRTEPYVGNRLIILSNIAAAPTAAGATGLAADGVATANLTVASNVPLRTAVWSILTGDIGIAAGNPAVLPAAATLRAGLRVGRFAVRAADSVFPNRRVDGRVNVVAVALRAMRAALPSVPPGTLSTNVSLNAQPGGRIVNWQVDAAAAAAGVTVNPPATGPGPPAMTVTVTRPAAFSGFVTVIATDSVLAARTSRVRIRFR